MKRITTMVLIAFLLLNICLLSSCNNNKIIGAWVPENYYSNGIISEGLLLKEDGTGLVDEGVEITWWIQNGILYIRDNDARSYSYSIRLENEDLLYIDECAYTRYYGYIPE